MLFSERYSIRKALLKKADMNRVRDLFAAKDAIDASLMPALVFTCAICDREHCNHTDCCYEAYDHTDARFCPCCGLYIFEGYGDC